MNYKCLPFLVIFYAGICFPQGFLALINCQRSPGFVTPNTDVTVSIEIKNEGDDIQKVELFKTVNGVEDSIEMNGGTGADSMIYKCEIPGVATDSAFVEYYIKATDSRSITFKSPGGNNRFSYFVLGSSKTFTIQHLRYSPYDWGRSGYNGYKVTVAGIVTADTSSIPGSGVSNQPRVYIQNGTTEWSGINLGFSGAGGEGVYDLKKGDSVIVTGIPVFNGSTGTRLDTIRAITIVSRNNFMPEAYIMKTDDVGISGLGAPTAEPWSGCIVKYGSITIDAANADSTGNYGESFCTDSIGGNHTRITWSDGRTNYNAGPDSEKVVKGDKFAWITGILSFTHGNYKLCPRDQNDIIVFEYGGVADNWNAAAKSYRLSQNYPNPFNPSTTISYEIPRPGMVVVKIFNVLGKEIRTIVGEFQNAGVHQIAFNASAMESGVYFYRLTSGEYSMVKKMVLVK